MTEAVQKRIDDLKRKLAARKGKKPYVDNCKVIEAEIDRLEALLVKAEPDG